MTLADLVREGKSLIKCVEHETGMVPNSAGLVDSPGPVRTYYVYYRQDNEWVRVYITGLVDRKPIGDSTPARFMFEWGHGPAALENNYSFGGKSGNSRFVVNAIVPHISKLAAGKADKLDQLASELEESTRSLIS